MLQMSTIKGQLTIGEVARVDSSGTKEIITDMMQNLAVSTPILRLTRDILSKNVVVKDVETKEVNFEVTRRIKAINGFEPYIESLAFLIFGEMVVYEKVFGKREEETDIRLFELNKLPNEYISYDIENHQSTGGLIYTDDESTETPITDENFLISFYGKDIDNPLGKGLFRYGVEQAWTDLQTLEAQLRALSSKYGNVIPVFGYEAEEALTAEGRKNLAERIESIKVLSSENNAVIGIPLGGNIKSLKEGFQFISLKDLSLDMHQAEIKRLEEKLETFLMGANFSSVDAGSNAKDEVQSNQKDKVTHHISRIVSKELQKLLQVDAVLFGYDASLFKVEMADYLSEVQENEYDQRMLTTEKMKATTMRDRAISFQATINAVADLKFNGLDDATIADLLEIDVAIVTPIVARDVSGGDTITSPNEAKQDIGDE